VQRQSDQQIIKSSAQLQLKDLLINRFAEGQVVCEVKQL
jgi:hypothetical protein